MIYGSVCSGTASASLAWKPLGWTPKFFSEIEPFPNAILAHRWPEVPNLGDFTEIDASAGPVDLLVGGTPCQSFSIAGRRSGLDDPRGNLALEFLRLAGRLRARWIVWENVAGVLSSGRGRDFGSILGAMVRLGYGFAYRVLDAVFFGVPQRRRRVLLVGYLGDWRPPVAALLEPGGLCLRHLKDRGPRDNYTSAVTRSLARGAITDNGAQARHCVVEPVGPAGRSRVRKLTPIEVERLQGFEDDYTRVPWRGKPAESCPDGHRYAAVGNAMAIPMMRWIGRRIDAVDDIVRDIAFASAAV